LPHTIAKERLRLVRLPLLNFPDGLHGLALFWLRLAATLYLARNAAECFEGGSALQGSLVGFAALLIAIGLVTAAPALLVATMEVVRIMLHRTVEQWSSFLVASILIALVLLGPGAYSIDRGLFGRKRLTIGRAAR
jgi:putative oxidoreductase